MAGLSFSGPAAGKRGYLFGNADPARGRGSAALNVSFSDFDPGDKAVLPVTLLLSSAHFSCAELGAPSVGASLLLDSAPACSSPATRLSVVYAPSTCTATINGSTGSATYPELSALMPCFIFAFGEASTLASDEAFNVTITAADVVANHNSGPAYLNYGSITVALNFTVTLSSAANSTSAASALFLPTKTPLDPWPGGDALNGNFRESAFTPAFAPLGLTTRARAGGGGAAVQQARMSLQGPACGRADTLVLSAADVASFVASGVQLNSTVPRSVVASCSSLGTDALESGALRGALAISGTLACGCGGGYIFANGTAAPAEYAQLLGAAQLFVGPRNDLPLASPRDVVFEVSSQWQPAATAASAYMEDYLIARLPVQPANDALRAPAGDAAAAGGVVRANLQELGGPPVVQLTVAPNCSDARLAGFGFPANAAACFEDDDPVAAVRGIALAPAVATQLSFYDFATASGSASINGDTSASADFALSPAGAPSLDCAGAPCWRRNYSLGGRASLPPWGLRISAGTTQLNFSLVVNDTFADDPVNASLAVSGLTLAVAVVPAAGSSGASAPNITAVVGPPGAGAGLSVLGGDAIDIFGSGLGFVGANVTGWLVGGMWPNDGVMWTLNTCAVIADMTHVRCTAPEGYGAGFSVVLQVYGIASAPSAATAASAAAALLSYETPRVLALAPFNAANLMRQASASASVTPTISPSTSVSATISLSPSVTPSLSPTASITPTVSVSPASMSPTPSLISPTSTRSNNSSPLSSPSSAPSVSASGSASSSASSLPSLSGSGSPSASQSAINTTAHGRLLREFGSWGAGAPRALQGNSTDNSTLPNATVTPSPSASASASQSFLNATASAIATASANATSGANATASTAATATSTTTAGAPSASNSSTPTPTATVSASVSRAVLPSSTPSPSNTPLLNVSLLQMLPAGGSDLLALDNPASGGLIGIQVTASGLPRRWLLPDAGISVSLVAGASEIFVPPCNRTGDFTLQCLVPQGASADLEVRVAYRGGSSRAPLVSFAGPSLDSVSIDSATGYRLVLLGRNLGSNASLVSGNLSLERVELLADPHFDDTTLAPGQRAARCAYAPCGPAPVLALACAYMQAQTHVECALDPASFGERLSVRIWVAGQASSWSAQTVDYPAPNITSIALLKQALGVPAVLSTRAGSGIACDGTSFVRVKGAGLIEGDIDAIQLVIGGITISNANLVFVGSNTPASMVATRNVAHAAIASIEARVPPGFGLVAVALRVGNRTAYSQLEYEAPTITKEDKGGDGVINYDVSKPRAIKLSGTGFSACAFCSDSRSTTSLWTATSSSQVAALCQGVSFNASDTGCALPLLYTPGPVVALNLTATSKLTDGTAVSAFVTDQTTNGALAALSVLSWSADGTSLTLQVVDMPSPTWALVKGNLTLSFAGASAGVLWAASSTDASLGFDFSRDLATLPNTVTMSPILPWAGPATPVTLKLNYAGGNAGSVRVAQYMLPEPPIFENAPFVFECPTVWNTTVTTKPPVTSSGSQAVKVPAFESVFSIGNRANVSGLTVGASCAATCSSVSFAGGILPLSIANAPCLSCVISDLGLERRFAWSKPNLLWQRLDADASCYVISWTGYNGVVNADPDEIVFAPPPWQGTSLFVKIVADGNEQASPWTGPFAYGAPAVQRVVPASGPTNRSVVTLRGATFGPRQTVREAFAGLSASGCVYNGRPWPADVWGDDMGTNLAYFQYSSTSGARSCDVESWATGVVVCLAPVGVPSSQNDVVVLAVDPISKYDNSSATSRFMPASLSGLTAAFKYNAPRVTALGRTGGGELLTVGGYELEVRGADLSAFPVLGAATNAFFADDRGQWAVSAALSAVAGAGIVQAGLDSNYTFTAFGHERIAFMLPHVSALAGAFCVFEGDVTATISFDSLFGAAAITIALPLTAAPPYIDTVLAVPDATFTDLTTDPCLALNTTTFLSFAAAPASASASAAPTATPSTSPVSSALAPSPSVGPAPSTLASNGSAALSTSFPTTSASASAAASISASPSASASNSTAHRRMLREMPRALLGATMSPSSSATASLSASATAFASVSASASSSASVPASLSDANATAIANATATASSSATASATASSSASGTASATSSAAALVAVLPSPSASANANATAVAAGTRIDGRVSSAVFDQCVMSARQVCADGSECVAGLCVGGEGKTPCACPDFSPCNATTSKCADGKTPCVSGVTATVALLPATAPCFRASGQTRIRILGRNFGSGKTTVNELKDPRFASVVQRVLLTSLSNAASPPVKCVVSVTNQADSVVTSDGTIECVLAADLPRGPVAVSLVQAFHSLAAADFGITPFAACPCGSFARLDGQLCAKCPAGALCAGAHLSAVARPDFWETKVDEWIAAPRHIPLALREPGSLTSSYWVTPQKDALKDFGYHDGYNSTATIVAPFVKCIDRTTCRANNTCAWTVPNVDASAVAAVDGGVSQAGSPICVSATTNWMCASCPSDCQKNCDAKTGACKCTPCPVLDRQNTAAEIFFGLVGVIVLGIAVAKKEAIVHNAKGAARCAGRCFCCQPGCERFNDQLDTEPPTKKPARGARAAGKERAFDRPALRSELSRRNIKLTDETPHDELLAALVSDEAKELERLARLVTRDDWYACSQCSAEWPAERAERASSADKVEGKVDDFSRCWACSGVGRAPAAVEQRARGEAAHAEERKRIVGLGHDELFDELDQRKMQLPEDKDDEEIRAALLAAHGKTELERIEALDFEQLRDELSERGITVPDDDGPACCGCRAREHPDLLDARKKAETKDLRVMLLSAPEKTAESSAAAAKAAKEREAHARSISGRLCCFRLAPPAPLPISSAHAAAAESTLRRAEVWNETHRKLPLASLFPTNRVLLFKFVLNWVAPAKAPPASWSQRLGSCFRLPMACRCDKEAAAIRAIELAEAVRIEAADSEALLSELALRGAFPARSTPRAELARLRRKVSAADTEALRSEHAEALRIEEADTETLLSELAQRGAFPARDTPRAELVRLRREASAFRMPDPIHAMPTWVLEDELKQLNVDEKELNELGLGELVKAREVERLAERARATALCRGRRPLSSSSSLPSTARRSSSS